MAMERENRPVRGAGKRRKKVCQFCVDKCECIDYKDAAKLRRFPAVPPAPALCISASSPRPSSALVRSPCCPS